VLTEARKNTNATITSTRAIHIFDFTTIKLSTLNKYIYALVCTQIFYSILLCCRSSIKFQDIFLLRSSYVYVSLNLRLYKEKAWDVKMIISKHVIHLYNRTGVIGRPRSLLHFSNQASSNPNVPIMKTVLWSGNSFYIYQPIESRPIYQIEKFRDHVIKQV